KQGGNNDGSIFPGELLERVGAWTGNRFGEREIFVVLALAEILRAKEFRCADDLGAGFGRAFGGAQGFFQICLGVRRATGLHQTGHDRGGGTLHRNYRRGPTMVVRSRMMVLPRASTRVCGESWPKSSRINLPRVSLVGP